MRDVDEQFWQQVEGDAKRTILCEPHRVAEIQAVIDGRGYDHLTLCASPFCPEGKLLVIDDGAIEAGFQQALQQSIRSIYR